MSLEVYYPQDILNAILAAEQSNSQALQAANGQEEFAKGYEAGYRAALNTIALAFGLIRLNLAWQAPVIHSWREVDGGVANCETT